MIDIENQNKVDTSAKRFLLPKISSEGITIIAVFFAMAFFLMLVSDILGMFGIALSLFAFYFFRDPERFTPEGDDLVISPADGILLPIREEKLPEELNMDDGKTYIKFSIFMSVFSVHVNRNPVSGVVKKTLYIPGKFINADLDKASKDNERNLIVVENKFGENVCYVQIAGLVARRIVSRLNVDQEVKSGDRFGLIKFGSRLDIYLPKDKYDINVLAGQMMISGETILAKRKKK